MLARFLRWMRQTPTRPLQCPHCGEDRLVERDAHGAGRYCAVCGRTWIDPPDDLDDPDDAQRRHWRRVLGLR